MGMLDAFLGTSEYARFFNMLHKLISRALALLSVVVVTGCANIPSGNPSAELGDKSKGVVTASLTYANGTHTMDAWFYIRQKGETDKDKSIRLGAKPPATTGAGMLGMLMPTRGTSFSEDPDRSGRVLAVSLPPGDYELYSWTLYIQVVGGYGYISPKTPPPPLPFSVKAGQVTYLGNLHAETLMGKNLFGISVPGSGVATIKDERQRDQPLIDEKFPMLEGWPVVNADLNGKAWAPVPTPQSTPTPAAN